MRFACLLPATLLVTACGVPDVSFIDAGSPRDATRDTNALDGPEADGASDGETDAEGDAASDSGDARTDAPDYCVGDAGSPDGLACCGTNVCAGAGCGMTNPCNKCAGMACSWPNVCCAPGGSNVSCKVYDGGC